MVQRCTALGAQGKDEFGNKRTISSDTIFNVKMYGQGGYPIYDGVVDAYPQGAPD